MKEYGIWEPFAVKIQTIKTAIEVRRPGHTRASYRPSRDTASAYSCGSTDVRAYCDCWMQAACLILRIDDIVSGMKRTKK
jgi:chaperonin GroEL (HSP60 family)